MDSLGDAFGKMITVLVVTCAISVPLGVWKLVEIIIYIYKHLNWE